MDVQAVAQNRSGELALEIFRQTLEAVRGDRLVRRIVKREGDSLHVDNLVYDLRAFDRVILAGAGKASGSMAAGVESVIGARIDSGLIVTKYGHSEPLNHCRAMEAGHPVPDENSLRAGEAMLELAASVTDKDLVLYLLSGGASALMESPVEGITLHDLRVVNEELLSSGATILTVNAIRSRLSKIKAGGLARAFAKATVVVLYMSDVEGDRLNVIGSGPFVAAKPLPGISGVVRALQLEDRLPTRVMRVLAEKRILEPPAQPEHRMVGNARMMGENAYQHAVALGLNPLQIPWMGNEAREFPTFLMKKELVPGLSSASERDSLIAVGETTVHKSGRGLGGRAQEMACAFADLIDGQPNSAVLIAGSDGTDGPTDAAGALVDGGTVRRAFAKGFEVETTLANNDSYHFHEAAGTLVRTGPTGTNLNDILIIVRS